MPRVLLLDEIDSSLHPSMIERLLNVVGNIFKGKYSMKVILATHSPTTVALAPAEAIYTLSQSDYQWIKKQEKQKAIEDLTEGFATLDVADTDLSINYNVSSTQLPVLFTEGITDKIIIENAWKKLHGDSSMPFYIQDCFDARFLGNLFRRGWDEHDGIFVNHSDKKLIALFDFDQEGYNAF